MRNPLELMKGAIAHFMISPKLFLGIIAVPLIIDLLLFLFEPSKGTGVINIYEWTLFGALAITLAVFNILSGIALIVAANDQTLSVRKAYGQASGFFWRYMGFTIVLSLILFVSFILFIIPAIIVSVWVAFAAFVLVLENARIMESMKRSREYVRGRWWAVFGRSVFIMFVAVVVMAIVTSLGSLISNQKAVTDGLVSLVIALMTPFLLLYVYLMYKDIKDSPMVSK